MFDMGFYPDLRKLIKVVPPADRRQTMLFSATLNAWVKNLAWEYTKSPFEIEIKPEIVTVEEIEQVLYHVPSEDKMKLLLGILAREQPESAVIFCNTKRYTEIIARRLRMNGFDCEFIIGDLPQSRRLKVIDEVKAGKIKFLVATDVAARGLDIEGLAMVVNYDLPVEAENYVHRIGRTARAGKTGKAVTLASEQDVYELPAIERYIGKKIPSEIAVPELFAEDKSAGQYIRTEFYEDRREERHLHGNAKAGEGRGARPHGQDRGGERRDSKRREGRAGDRVRGNRKTEGRRSGADARKGGEARSTAAATGQRQEGGQELSRLSFEERMALYKKKYNPAQPGAVRDGGGKKAAAGKTEAGGKGRKWRGSRGNARQSAAGQLPPEKKNTNAGGGKRPAVRNDRQKQAQPAAAKQTAAPEKKGILSRFLGIFKKQGKGEP
jgi:ATP-dependent RNA helicase RhlB